MNLLESLLVFVLPKLPPFEELLVLSINNNDWKSKVSLLPMHNQFYYYGTFGLNLIFRIIIFSGNKLF